MANVNLEYTELLFLRGRTAAYVEELQKMKVGAHSYLEVDFYLKQMHEMEALSQKLSKAIG